MPLVELAYVCVRFHAATGILKSDSKVQYLSVRRLTAFLSPFVSLIVFHPQEAKLLFSFHLPNGHFEGVSLVF